MTDDYQDLAKELGATNVGTTNTGTQTVNNTASQTANNEPDKTDPATQTTDPAKADPAKSTQTSATPDVDNSDAAKANKAFAELRAKNARYEKVFTKLREARGAANEDELLEALETEAYTALGKAKNNDPETLKRIDELEARNAANDQAAREQITVMKLKSLQDKLTLSDTDITKFVQDAVKTGVDLLHSDMDFNILYNSMYLDTILNNKIEAARQEWIARDGKAANSASDVNDTKGKSQTTSNKVETMAQFETVLSEFDSKK